jgi:Double zinc ribbon
MAGQFCSHCGGQNPPGAAFCQYCGSTLTASSSAPLPPSGPTLPPVPAAAPPSWAPSGYAGAQPPRRHSSVLRIVVIVIVVVLIIAVLAYLFLPTSSPAGPIDVTLIAFQSADNTCGLNGVEYYGFNASLSSSLSLEFAMNNSNASATQCTIHTVATTTPGFSIGGASPLPCVIPASETVTWTVTINVPSSDYTGVLTLVVT